MITKLVNASRGLILAFRYVRTFDISLFKGKRVAIVGPADSAYKEKNGEWLDSFDYVVRMNKAPLLLEKEKNLPYIGTRCDVLFHNFFENNESGGGKLDMALYEEIGITYVINPRNTFAGLRRSFNFYKKYLEPYTTYTLPRKFYRDIAKTQGEYHPTMGLSALMTLLRSDFSELYITGFTFFRTPFGEGYRDQMKDPVTYIKKAGVHDIDLEFSTFLAELKKQQHKNIIMDEDLENIVKEAT